MKAEKRFRELKIERKAIDEESRTVELAFSSEEPYERSFGIEVLDHADGSGLPTHRARVAEVRDVFMSDCIATSITDDSTETLTCVAVQNFSFAQRVEDNYFIGEISFDVVCYGSE
jgi:hypothetical protein